MALGRSRRASSALLIGGILGLLAGASVLARTTASVECCDPAAEATRTNNLQTFEQAAEGDLVFRSGRDMVSRLVLSQSDTPQFSHVGVIVRRDGRTLVVHALPKEGDFAGGVVIEPLSKFASMDNASSVGLYRVERLGAAERVRVRAFLLQQVGKPFDDRFLMTDDSAMYCTELAVKAYADSDVDLSEWVGRIEVLTMPEPVVTPDALSVAPGVRRVVALYDQK